MNGPSPELEAILNRWIHAVAQDDGRWIKMVTAHFENLTPLLHRLEWSA